MKPYWRAKRIENPVGAGTPDVYFTTLVGSMGWMELKSIPSWPKKENTLLKIRHFSPEQRLFMKLHGRAGANVWMFLRVHDEHFLLWWGAALKIGTLTADEIRSNARGRWGKQLDYEHIYRCLNIMKKS